MRFATNTGKAFYSFSHKRMLTCPLLFLLRIETELDRRDASQSLLRSDPRMALTARRSIATFRPGSNQQRDRIVF